MQDIVPMDWVDEVEDLTDINLNTEIRDAYLLLLNPPICVVKRTTVQSIPTGSGIYTALSWSTAIVDTEDPATPMFSIGNPTRITITTPGWYECNLTLNTNSLPVNQIIHMGVRVNATTVYMLDSMLGAPDVAVTKAKSGATPISLNANDYVEFVVVHSYGASLNIDPSENMPNATVIRMRGI